MENSKCQCNLLLDNFPSKSFLFHSRVIRFPLFRTQLIRTKPVSNFDTSLLGNVFDVAAKFFDRNRGPSPSRFGKIVKKKKEGTARKIISKNLATSRELLRAGETEALFLSFFFHFSAPCCFCSSRACAFVARRETQKTRIKIVTAICKRAFIHSTWEFLSHLFLVSNF